MPSSARMLAIADSFSSFGEAALSCRCTDMTSACWPRIDAWAQLNASVGGQLVSGRGAASPVATCAVGTSSSAECATALNNSKSTEFWNMKFTGGFQSTGLNGGFSTQASEYAVVARSAEDVRHAVSFARTHNLRLVVKGAGHDYMGRNTAPSAGSLLVATFKMLNVRWSDDNTTVTVEAGVPWQDVYEQAQARGLYVQGGHCPSVGAAGGFSLGAGFGPMSRSYGTGADNMVSATVVTANGDLLVANETSNADVFWALRGGGGGTFGVVASITYRTHPAPRLGGYVWGKMTCKTEAAFRQMLEAFLKFLPQLFTPHWGDSITPSALTKSINLGLLFVGISESTARSVLEPWSQTLAQLQHCGWEHALGFSTMPSLRLQDGSDIIKMYPYAGAHRPSTGDPGVDRRLVDGFLGQLNQWSFGQGHRYIPEEDFQKDAAGLAEKLIELTKYSTTYRTLQLSKALAGGAGPNGNVSANPLVRKAGVALMGNEHVANYFPHLPQNARTLWNFIDSVKGFFSGGLCAIPNEEFRDCLTPALLSMTVTQVAACWDGVHTCFDFRSKQFKNYTSVLRHAFPTGSYVNEGDYFESDWATMFWGSNYPRLLAVKKEVDPDGLFVCHHCVGSEEWSEDGNCPAKQDIWSVVV